MKKWIGTFLYSDKCHALTSDTVGVLHNEHTLTPTSTKIRRLNHMSSQHTLLFFLPRNYNSVDQ